MESSRFVMPEGLVIKLPKVQIFFVFGKGEARFLKELLSVRPEKALEEGAQKIITIYSQIKKSG